MTDDLPVSTPVWGGVVAFPHETWEDLTTRMPALNQHVHDATAAANAKGVDLTDATLTYDADRAVLTFNASTNAPDLIGEDEAAEQGLPGRPMMRVRMMWHRAPE